MHLVKGSFLCAITLKKRWDVSPALLSQIHMRIMNAVVVVLQTQQCETSQWRANLFWSSSLIFLVHTRDYALFGRYYITKRTTQIAANLAIYAVFLVVKIISIDNFLLLTIISSHSMLIKKWKIRVFPKFAKNPKICLMNMLIQFRL